MSKHPKSAKNRRRNAHTSKKRAIKRGWAKPAVMHAEFVTALSALLAKKPGELRLGQKWGDPLAWVAACISMWNIRDKYPYIWTDGHVYRVSRNQSYYPAEAVQVSGFDRVVPNPLCRGA